MGLIKAAAQAIGGELHDQWKDFVKCENMDMNTLMVKKTTPNGVISKGSGVIVGPGQIAVIYDQGKILDATAEEGVYTFDSNTSPSFFSGDFGAVFKDMWTRFTYAGAAAKDQAVFFINAKEIMDNKFGTKSPVSFRDYDYAIPNEMTGKYLPLSVEVKCFGNYTYKITDPAAFMKEYAGTAEVVTKEEINEQMRSEVIETLQAILNTLGTEEYKVPILELPSKTATIKKLMDENVFDANIRERGIQIKALVIESVTPTDDSKRKMEEYEHNASGKMQQGRVLDVMEKAATNPGGASNGFMGVGMMNVASGGLSGGVMQNAFNAETTKIEGDPSEPVTKEAESAPVETAEEAKAEEVAPTAKFCSNCGTKLEGAKFCPNCGTKVG